MPKLELVNVAKSRSRFGGGGLGEMSIVVCFLVFVFVSAAKGRK